MTTWTQQDEVACMVGCYSEAFFECSYNDNDVLGLLLTGGMNAEAVKALADTTRAGWFVAQMGNYMREDGDYAGALLAACRTAGGWPTQYAREDQLKRLETVHGLGSLE